MPTRSVNGTPDVNEEKYPPDDDSKTARAARNGRMVDKGAAVCLVFPRGPASEDGTWDCIERARAAKIPVVFG